MNKYIILILILISNSSAFASNKVSNLISPVSYFINHIKQFQLLDNNLKKHNNASLVGVSGIGKTQLARMYAYENKYNYDIIWFFDCNLDIDGEFLKLARQLNKVFKANISEDTGLAKSEVIEYLKHQDKWLLIFDNLKINENKKVQDLIDWEHNGNVIFCSQDKERLLHSIEMTHLNKDDSITLANNILENITKEQAEFLATNFNGYPILIVQAGQLLNQTKGLDLETYKKKILQSADKIKINITLAIKELKPSAVNLLHKIALINNQAFSKDLLSYIADDKDSLDDDIYQISKFALIANIDSNNENPIFEMHDIIAQKVSEINGNKKDREVLEKLIDNLLLATPNTIAEFHVFRSGKTIFENFKVISKYTEKYKVNLLKAMSLNLYLLTQYNNYSDYNGAEKLVLWFNKHDNTKNFKSLLMNNDERARYADFLQSIARYYRNRHADFAKSVQYCIKSKDIYENVEGYEEQRADLFYQLALNELKVGNIVNAEKYVLKLKDSPITFINNVEAILFYLKGKYNLALDRVNALIKIRLNKIKHDDLVLTANYILRVQILNSLNEYKEAYNQALQLYNMHKLTKKDDHLIFGRIYAQMARSELGLGNLEKASDHINKAIEILLANENKEDKGAKFSENPDLASGYVVRGDIYSLLGKYDKAIKFYREAQGIYLYLYKDNIKNIAQVSYLYTQGAKAACKIKDLYHYKCFGEPQVKEFGREHANTISMFEYCKDYNMDLWQEEN